MQLTRTCAVSVLVLLAYAAGRAADAPSEYQVKAAFLLNFLRFLEWPVVNGGSSGPFVIGIFGSDPFAGSLDQVVTGKTVNGRPIQVRRISEAAAFRACHVIFVPVTETRRFSDLLATVTSLSALTVGESDGFASKGGVINFVVEEERVRFEINPQAAARAQLHISSKLLQLATIVSDSGRKK